MVFLLLDTVHLFLNIDFVARLHFDHQSFDSLFLCGFLLLFLLFSLNDVELHLNLFTLKNLPLALALKLTLHNLINKDLSTFVCCLLPCLNALLLDLEVLQPFDFHHGVHTSLALNVFMLQGLVFL